MSKALNYKEYYLRAIRENCNGFKPVHGGTGLGKTHGIIKAIEEGFGDRKYIYVAHRKNLLHEMCESLNRDGIGHVLMKSDEDQLRGLLTSSQLKFELNDFCKSPLVKKYIAALDKNGKYGSILAKRAKNSITELQRLFDISYQNPGVDIQDKIDSNVSNIFQFIKKILIDASRVAKGIKNPEKWQTKRDYADLLNRYETMLYQLFPFIRFARDEKKKALVLTLHKLFHGLFSGEKTLRVNNLKGYVIFLDEFDFLEPILLEKICEEVPIEDPFLMLNYFKSNAESKLKTSTYPVGEHHDEIKRKLAKSLESIDKLYDTYQFPAVRHFMTNDDKLFGNWIFLTNQTIVDRSIYLKPDTEKGIFEITSKASHETKDGFPLLRTVLNTSSSILRSFAGWKDRNNEIYEEILFDVLGRTEFQRTIKRIPFYHSLTNKNKNFVNNYTHLLERGMGLFTLNKPNDPTEPKEVKIEYYNISTSPERILFSLIQKNLVFGLSATSKLNRIVGHFDESWLRDQVEYLADNEIRYFEDNDLDKKLIQQLTGEKAKKRENTVLLESIGSECNQVIASKLEDLEQDQNASKIQDNGGHHKNRVTGFFRILEWIAHKLEKGVNISEIKSHLVFLNSLQQIDYFLKLGLEGFDNFGLDEILTVEENKSSGKRVYRIQYEGIVFNIVLLEGKAYENIYPENYHEPSNVLKLFWEENPVVFLTTYPSAANGVNLQYYPSKRDWENDRQEDFRCIHLLEGPHFYFASYFADYSKKFTERKKDLWKAAKLHMNDPVSRENFKGWSLPSESFHEMR